MKRPLPWLSVGISLLLALGFLWLADAPESKALVRSTNAPEATKNPFVGDKYPHHSVILMNEGASMESIRNPNPSPDTSKYRNVYEVQFFPEAIGADPFDGESNIFVSILKIDENGTPSCLQPHPDNRQKCGLTYAETVATTQNLQGWGENMGTLPWLTHSALGIGHGVARGIMWYAGLNLARMALVRVSKLPQLAERGGLRGLLRGVTERSGRFLTSVHNRIQNHALGHSFTLLAVILIPQFIEGQEWADRAYADLGFRNREELASILNGIFINSEARVLTQATLAQARRSSPTSALVNAPRYQALDGGALLSEHALDATTAFLEQMETENYSTEALIERRLNAFQEELRAAGVALDTDVEATAPYTVEFLTQNFENTSSDRTPLIEVALKAFMKRDQGGCLNDVQIQDGLSPDQRNGLEILGLDLRPSSRNLCLGVGSNIHRVGFYQNLPASSSIDEPLRGLPVRHQ